MAASREEVFERVKEVLKEQLGVEDDQITEEASFQNDLDADSLDLVEVNPILDEANETAALAVELAASALGARIL